MSVVDIEPTQFKFYGSSDTENSILLMLVGFTSY